MIYLDNAATTFPKPKSVSFAMNYVINNLSANPGRSGHAMSIKASEEIYSCRKAASRLFKVREIENIVFTSNCTHALNIVIKGLLKPGDHAIISNLEHNSVVRPLDSLSKHFGISYSIADVSFEDDDETLNNFRKLINSSTKLVICTHASNVWGIRLPVERLSAMCKQYGIAVCVDAAQSAGHIDIDFDDNCIDYLCMAGHKGLYGPMGTGLLIVKNANSLPPLIEGGTGSKSMEYKQPEFMPDRFESGTLNLPGISGLRAGIEFVERQGIKNIHKKEVSLINRLYKLLCQLPKVDLYTNNPASNNFVPLLSFNIYGKKSEEVAEYLNRYSIAVRAGLHCSPLAHKLMGTLETGAVRVAPSIFNSANNMDMLASKIKRFCA